MFTPSFFEFHPMFSRYGKRQTSTSLYIPGVILALIPLIDIKIKNSPAKAGLLTFY
ncbi:hypothetical protein HMPREF0557_00900 [Listeria innocua ATCC 33091]|uniref:Uncharacterized protein n=1 Tax=Listeria innocua ATCC 33091 TaxID=1002366 RepID=A0AB72ZAV6_LISIO|nr:hypothetical protein HMPREF0557_00900 [Listeria innocua ATCC 33091]